MRELVYFVAVSLDGRISGPGDDFSGFPVEGDHMDWIHREYTDTLPAPGLAAAGLTADRSRFSAVLMGWNTYALGLPLGVDSPYPHLDQVVFTRSHADADVPEGIRLVSDDPVTEVRRLKEASGSDIWLCGGGILAGVLADEIDRLVLKVNPVVLGEGVALFDHPYDPRAFGLTRSTPFRSGVVVNEYARASSAG